MSGFWKKLRDWWVPAHVSPPRAGEWRPLGQPAPIAARNEALEAAIREASHDPELVRLYADWLMEQGDLGGEYLALTLEVPNAGGAKRDAISERRMALVAHQPSLRIDHPDFANATFRYGLVREISLRSAGPAEQALLDHRWAFALEKLMARQAVLDALIVADHVAAVATDAIEQIKGPPVLGTLFRNGKVQLTVDWPEPFRHGLLIETTFLTPDGERTAWWGTSYEFSGLSPENDVSFRSAHVDAEVLGWRIRARLIVRGIGTAVFHYQGQHTLKPCEPFTDGPFAKPAMLEPTGMLPTPPRWTLHWDSGAHRHGSDTVYTLTNGTKTHRIVPENGYFAGLAGNARHVAWSEYYTLHLLDTKTGRRHASMIGLQIYGMIGMNDQEVWAWDPESGDVTRFALPGFTPLEGRNRKFMMPHMLTHRGMGSFGYHPDPDRAAWVVFPDPDDERGLVGWLDGDGTVRNALIRDTGTANDPVPGAFGWVDVLADGTIEVQGTRGVWRIRDGVVTLWNRQA